jgi:hypothetical protein
MNHRLHAILLSGAAAACTAAVVPEAMAADPTTADCLTASLASLKLGNEHKVRQERAQLLVCAADSCPADIRKECVRRVDEVNAAVPTIIFGARDLNGNDLSQVKVTMDDEVLAERLEGTALSIDPGAHTFVFETAGLPRVEKHYVIQQAQKDRRETIVFGVAASGEPPPPPNDDPRKPVQRPTGEDSSSPPASDSGASTKRIVGYSLIGLGAVGIGVAVAEQVTALGRASDSNTAAASSSAAVRATARPIHDQAAQAQTYAIVLGAAGVVAIGGGLFLVLTAQPSSSTTAAKNAATATWRVVPEIGPQSAGLTVAGTF